MSEFPDDLHVETDNDSDLVRTLRAALKAARKENGELSTKVETFEKQSRASTIESILTEKKVSPKVAKLIPESIQADAAQVQAWLDEFADVFNITQGEPAGEPSDADTDDGDGDGEGGLDQDVAAAIGRLQRTEVTGQPSAPIGVDQIQKVLAQAREMKPEEGREFLQKHGLMKG